MVKLKGDLVLDVSIIPGTKGIFLPDETKQSLENFHHYRKPVCPFICSTFVDLEDEFKHLHSNVFVQLSDLCKQRGSHFTPVDYRRTAIDNRSSSEYILKYSLDNVHTCSPYFICIIGNHYGSHRPVSSKPLSRRALDDFGTSNQSLSTIEHNLLAAANHGHSWLLEGDTHLCSMMEVEVLSACFSASSDVPMCCYFYFKDCYGSAQETDTFFEAESDYAQDRLNDLKRRIVNKGFPVKYFTSKEELGEEIYKDWSEVIFNSFPTPTIDFISGDELLHQRWSQQTLLHRLRQKYHKYIELQKLEEKLNSHALAPSHASEGNQHGRMSSDDEVSLSGFKTGDGIFSTSMSFVESIKSQTHDCLSDGDEYIFALVGDPGIGKTTFLSNWLHDFKKQHPDVLVISEFISSSYLTYDITSFMRRCIRILRETHFKTKSMPNEMLTNVESYSSLIASFASSLHLMPCVIVIDGVNELLYAMDEDIGSVKGLSWLPSKIPSTCRIIITTRKSDLSFKSLESRNDVIIDCMPAIDLSTRECIFEKHFKKDVATVLGRDFLEKIWTNRLSERPLFLATLSDLLHSCRNKRDVEQVIDKCTAFRIFRDFWKSVFLLWSRRFSWSKQSSGQPGSIRQRSNAAGWVADALRLIATSRCGLHVSEILHLLSLVGYRGRATVTSHDWDMFMSAACGALCTAHDGMIRVGHEDTRLAIGHCLLNTGKYLLSQSNTTENVQQQYHTLLGSYFMKYSSMERKLIELPWQLQQGKDWLMLCQVLCKQRFFLAMCEESLCNPALYLDHVSYWRDLIMHDFNVLHCLQIMIEQSTKVPGLVLEDRNDLSRRLSGATQITQDGSSKQRQVTNLLMKAPSMIIITQHDDAPMSTHKTTDESRSETEERDFSETESCMVFLTETEVDHHLLVAGWAPGEGNPVNLIDASLLDDNELADLHVKSSWLLFQLGDDFRENGKDAIRDARDYLENSRPLTTRQLLASFEIALLECHHIKPVKSDNLLKAIAVLENISLETMDLSYTKKRDLIEAKGLMLLEIARCFLKESQFEDVHGIILKSIDLSHKCGGIYCRAQATSVFGQLLMSQDLRDQAEMMFSKAFTILVKWKGEKHISVANVLHDMAYLFSTKLPKNGINQRKAMLAYKQALEILQFNKKKIEAAKISNEIGQLLLEEGSLCSKQEAQICFERSVDVFITEQVDVKQHTRRATRNYKRATSDLRTGRFMHGREKNPDSRTSERPFSSLTWHSVELNRIRSGYDDVIHSSPYDKRRCGLAQSANRPYSSYSTQSVGNYVLVTPRYNSSRRAKSARTRTSSGLSPHQTCSSKYSQEHEQNTNCDEEEAREIASKSCGNEIIQVCPLSVQERPGTSEEVPVIIVPAGRNSRMSVKVEMEDKADDILVDRLRGVSARSEHSTPKRSVRLHATPSVINDGRKFPHKHHCAYLSGPQHISMTVHGPYSSVSDVLRSPASSRSRSTDVNHKCAWHHVPGRYVKPGEILPRKRSQSRPGSGATTSTRCISSPTRSLPPSRQSGRLLVNPSSIMSTRAPSSVVLRRHSEPQLHNTLKVAFDRPIREEIPYIDSEDAFVSITPVPSLA